MHEGGRRAAKEGWKSWLERPRRGNTLPTRENPSNERENRGGELRNVARTNSTKIGIAREYWAPGPEDSASHHRLHCGLGAAPDEPRVEPRERLLRKALPSFLHSARLPRRVSRDPPFSYPSRVPKAARGAFPLVRFRLIQKGLLSSARTTGDWLIPG